MFKTARGMTVLVAAFALTLVALRYLNRPSPIIAFEKTLTLESQRFMAHRFGAVWPTTLVFTADSESGVNFDVLVLTEEEYSYHEAVHSGKAERVRPVDFLWESRDATSHHSDPIRIDPGTIVFYVQNNSPDNTGHVPIVIDLKAKDLLTVD